jgi:hypothetical protein
VELSADAAAVSQLSAQARAAEPDNSARVAQIRARLQSGYYESQAARQQIADGLLAADGMRATLDDIAAEQAARRSLEQVPESRADRVAAARDKVARGHYDTAQSRQATAARILDALA